MLADPLYVGRVTPSKWTAIEDALDAVTFTDVDRLAVTDLSPGATQRQYSIDGVKHRMSINHSQTKENAPLVTDRSVIRMETQKVNAELGKTVTAAAYLVVAAPTGGDFTEDEILELVWTLLHFALIGDVNSDGTAKNETSNQALRRILTGEP